MTPVVQQAGEPRVRFECVLSELLARVDDDALVGRVQDAWAALLGSKRASEPTPDDLEWIADNIVAFGDFAKEAELLRNRAALDRALTSRLQAGEPTETVFLRLLNRWDMDAGYQLTDFIRDARALLASRPQQPQAETPLTEPGPSAPETPLIAQKYDDTLLPFLALMRRELHANSGKGDRPGWLTMSREQGLLEIYWHTAKLSVAVKKSDEAAIAEHSADVANMAMMLADVCGVLAHPNTGAHPPEAEPVADAHIKAAYIEQFGSDNGWLGPDGSWFIEGFRAGQKYERASPPEAQEPKT